jgi:hypothetical protein
MRSANIGPVYLESNNAAKLSDTSEVIIGDATVDPNTVLSSTINGIFFNEPYKDPNTKEVYKFKISLEIQRAWQVRFNDLYFGKRRPDTYDEDYDVGHDMKTTGGAYADQLTFSNTHVTDGIVDCEPKTCNVWIAPHIKAPPNWLWTDDEFWLRTDKDIVFCAQDE